MNRPKHWIAIAGLTVFAVSGFFAYRAWRDAQQIVREELLAYMPASADAVFYLDAAELRASAFVKALYAWLPSSPRDADYAQFVRETNFDYERDLNHLAIAVTKHGAETSILAVADGQFDRKRIVAYAAKLGSVKKSGRQEVFSVPADGSQRNILFTFLRDDRIAFTNEPDLAGAVATPETKTGAAVWHERFRRLEGVPIFAVLRQDSATSEALANQTPSGVRSPQLAALLNQLQWITFAGKPLGNDLRLVIEGECSSDRTARQLADLLKGVVLLAQGGLNDAKTRQQMNPEAREAYLELLNGTDISRLDRVASSSVRVVIEVTPKILEIAKSASPAIPATPSATPGKAAQSTGSVHN